MPASGRLKTADLSGSTPQPEPRDNQSTRLDAHPMGRLAASIGILAVEAKSKLEGLKNISRENHTVEQVVTKLLSVVDKREMGVAVDRLKKTRNQKVVVSCSSSEDAEKIEERLKMRGADLTISKPEKRLATMVIRDVLRVNTDEDVVKSLRTQNRHITEGFDWDKESVKVCRRRRARNDLECHPVLEVTPELYKRLIKAGYIYVGLQRRPDWDQSPLVQCSRCLGFGCGKQYYMDVSDKCAHCGEGTLLQRAEPGTQMSHHDVLIV
ncbi:hypothetical protein EVAR_25524_1 [Eumeta japonica]|uniref:Uncharacterized protein n=1 Tax=Eumeta variegata TaxID=151549 RepID=A0A4C1VMF4_EUMVA|nr:hypothetical protein EVAR_25524_1 [Eumeta japonica]